MIIIRTIVIPDSMSYMNNNSFLLPPSPGHYTNRRDLKMEDVLHSLELEVHKNKRKLTQKV